MKWCVDPRKGLANSPDVVLISDDYEHRWEKFTYWRTGPCFWSQSQITGQTMYLFHTADTLFSRNGVYQTEDGGGFGGAVFKLKVYNMFGTVHLRGPWSGGAYCANQYLPKHVIEVRRIDSEGRSHSLNLPIDMVNEGLRNTGWQCWLQPNRDLTARYGKEIRYEAMYKGNNKDLFTDEQMEEAHALYQEAAGNWLQRLQSDFVDKVRRLQKDYEAVEDSGEEEPGTEADVEVDPGVGRSDVWFD